MADSEERIKIQFDTNADDTKKSVDGLNASIDVSVDENEKLASSQSKVVKGSKEQKAGFEDLGGGIGGAISQVKGLSKQFLALLANPVVLVLSAIVLVLGGLFKAFTSTKLGGEKFEQVMSGIGAVMDVLRDRYLKIIDVAKKLFSGDVIGAAKEYISIFKGAGDEIASEFKKAADAAKELQKVTDATRDLSESRAKLNRDLSESERILTSQNSTYKEKQKALEEVSKAEAKQALAELENARRSLKAIEALNALSDSSGEALQKASDARIKIYGLEQKSAEDRRKVQEFNKTLENEESARLKSIADERKARDKERNDREKALQKERDERRKAELKAIEDFNKMVADKEMALLKQIQDSNAVSAQEKLDLQKQRDAEELRLLEQKGANIANLLAYNNEIYAAKQLEIDEANLDAKKVADKKLYDQESEAKNKQAEEDKIISDAMIAQEKSILDAKVNIAEQGVALLSNVFGKSKGVQKAAIVAENAIGIGKMVIANNAANIGALATPQAIATSGAAAVPVIALNNISTALGVATTIAATAKALKAVGGGGSAGSAPQLPSVRGAAATPQAGFQASSENQIATSISNNQQDAPVIKAYVVAQDMTDQQAKDKKLVSDNSFGGIN